MLSQGEAKNHCRLGCKRTGCRGEGPKGLKTLRRLLGRWERYRVEKKGLEKAQQSCQELESLEYRRGLFSLIPEGRTRFNGCKLEGGKFQLSKKNFPSVRSVHQGKSCLITY